MASHGILQGTKYLAKSSVQRTGTRAVRIRIFAHPARALLAGLAGLLVGFSLLSIGARDTLSFPEDVAVAAFSTSGLIWPDFSDDEPRNDFVLQYYNPERYYDGDHAPVAAEKPLLNTHLTWSSVPGSSFRFQYGGVTNRCPSLAKGCYRGGRRDGYNDVGWLALPKDILAMVYYTTKPPFEADMVLNLNAVWGKTDIETVLLHENGHVAGLGHSKDRRAIMYPLIIGIKHSLGSDDMDGLLSLYPSD